MMYYALVILAVFAAACSQMLLKRGARMSYKSFLRQYLNPWVLGGYTILGLTMVLNIFCMSKGVQVKELGLLESMSYLFVPVLSFFLFGEKLSWKKVGAIAVIIVGMIVFFM